MTLAPPARSETHATWPLAAAHWSPGSRAQLLRARQTSSLLLPAGAGKTRRRPEPARSTRGPVAHSTRRCCRIGRLPNLLPPRRRPSLRCLLTSPGPFFGRQQVALAGSVKWPCRRGLFSCCFARGANLAPPLTWPTRATATRLCSRRQKTITGSAGRASVGRAEFNNTEPADLQRAIRASRVSSIKLNARENNNLLLFCLLC